MTEMRFFRIGFRVLAGAAVVVAMSGHPALAAFPGGNGELAVRPVSGAGVVLVSADGKGERRICRHCRVSTMPRWSPDGRALVFNARGIKVIATLDQLTSLLFL